jgi:hypothetical protein
MIQVMSENNSFGFVSNEIIDPTQAAAPPTSSSCGRQEQQSSAHQCPSLKRINTVDVICGRDKITHSHCGNKRFRHIIEMNREAYQKAPRKEKKTKITIEIVNMIRECGGRFLKLDEPTGEWQGVSDHDAREKVSHALRSAKDPNRPRIKKKREVVMYTPTPEEDAIFQETLSYQQQIFQSLLEREAQGMGELYVED